MKFSSCSSSRQNISCRMGTEEYNITAIVNHNFPHGNLPVIIICIFGVVSNGLLLVAFIKDPLKCFRNSGTYLVMNLSVFDCLTCLLSSIYLANFKFILHSVTEFFMSWFGMTSFVSITSISLDRLLLVAYPIKYRALVEGKCILLSLALIWTVSCISPVVGLLGDHNKHVKSLKYTFSVMAVIMSAFMYAFTFHKLKKQSRNIALQNSNENRAQEIRILKEQRFLKTIIIIACIAFVCTVPALIYLSLIYNLALTQGNSLIIIQKMIVSILYTNFAVNPLIYIIRLPNYRRTFYLLCCRRAASS